ncbi:MAG: heavy metal translocating P-type ATPase [bacterium]
MKSKTFHIEGMHCASCSRLIEKTLSKKQAVEDISVNLARGSALIRYDEKGLSFDDVKKEISELGYKVVKKPTEKETSKYLTRFILALVLSIPVASSMFYPLHTLPLPYRKAYNVLIIICGAFVVCGAGSNFHYSFLLKLRKLHFNMDSLISIGSLTAFFYSVVLFLLKQTFHHFLEGANFIITFILLGKYLEARTRGKASEALQKLFEFQVTKATIIKDGKEEMAEVDAVDINSVMIVKSGEKIPLDGIILEGGANIDESMLTGESMPVFKESPAPVFAASFVLDGVVKARVTKRQENTIFSTIIKMVDAAQNSKAPIQHLADKVAEVFVPVIISIALGTFIVWYFIYGGDLSASLLPAVAVLVVACPCALGLATPTAIMVASGKGAQQGIIVKDGESLEKSSKITTVVFDKTGTLTAGKPEVTDIISQSLQEEDFLRNAVSLAKASQHPLSKAIVAYGESHGVDPLKLNNMRELSGKGIEGTDRTGNLILRLGNLKFMKENAIHIPDDTISLIDGLSSEGKTVVFLSINDNLGGLIAFMDRPKPDSAKAVKELKRMGKDVYLISGDNYTTTHVIARELGIDNVIAEVLPYDKAEKIRMLQSEGKNVAFVGDGINDAPALAVADLGIAMGTGSDIAKETGNLILVRGNPSRVVTALKLVIHTYGIIKQNLFWAFIYNIIGVPLAAFGKLPPVYASLAMSLSSVSVVTNSLRIKIR